MGDKLDMINAAIALGDIVFPPNGSRIYVDIEISEQWYRSYIGTVKNWNHPESVLLRIDDEFIDRYGGQRVGTIVVKLLHDRYEILELPKKAPPFKKWRRVDREWSKHGTY